MTCTSDGSGCSFISFRDYGFAMTSSRWPVAVLAGASCSVKAAAISQPHELISGDLNCLGPKWAECPDPVEKAKIADFREVNLYRTGVAEIDQIHPTMCIWYHTAVNNSLCSDVLQVSAVTTASRIRLLRYHGRLFRCLHTHVYWWNIAFSRQF